MRKLAIGITFTAAALAASTGGAAADHADTPPQVETMAALVASGDTSALPYVARYAAVLGANHASAEFRELVLSQSARVTVQWLPRGGAFVGLSATAADGERWYSGLFTDNGEGEPMVDHRP